MAIPSTSSCAACRAPISVKETVGSSMWHVANGIKRYRALNSKLREVEVAFYPVPIGKVRAYAVALQAGVPKEPAFFKWSVSLDDNGEVPGEIFQKIAEGLTEQVNSRADDFRARNLYVITRVAPL